MGIRSKKLSFLPHLSQTERSLPHHFFSDTVRIAAALMKEPMTAPAAKPMNMVILSMWTPLLAEVKISLQAQDHNYILQEMKAMPIVVVNIKEGRTLEQKRDMVTKVTDALCETMEVPKTSVRIIINEMANDNFAIAGTLICDNPDAQVKKKS